MSDQEKTDPRLPIVFSVGIVFLMSVVLWSEGRIWWCKLGDWAIYINEAWKSSHTSQHVFDPYTFTHVLHGVAFFWLAGMVFSKLANGWRFLIATVLESAWEILENSDYIIEKYRENTASLDYFGDTIANSIGDVAACALGFWVAVKLGVWRSLAFFVAVELLLIFWIRDSLLINILMLVYPIDGIKQWQMAIG